MEQQYSYGLMGGWEQKISTKLIAFIYFYSATIQMQKEVSLKDPTKGTHTPEALGKFVSACKDLKSHINDEDKEILSTQTQKLKSYQTHLSDIKAKIDASCSDCDKNILNLEGQSKDLQKSISDYNALYKAQNKEGEYKNNIAGFESRVVECCKKRISIANSINFKLLSKLDIDDRKSKAHEVFKWIIVSIYGEPENKYYWPNFQEEALEKDEAVDLKERLGKVSALQAKEEQKLKTAYFLQNYKDIRNCEEFGEKDKVEIDKIRDIAQEFSTSIDISKKIKENQVLISNSQKKNQDSEEKHSKEKAKLEALTDRIGVIKIYEKQIKSLKGTLQAKRDLYAGKIVEAEKNQSDLLSVGKGYVIATKSEGETREPCECTIY